LIEQILRASVRSVQRAFRQTSGAARGVALVEVSAATYWPSQHGARHHRTLPPAGPFVLPVAAAQAVIEGNIIADFRCNKSFNCSYSAHDL
jgi:hypothetical protein